MESWDILNLRADPAQQPRENAEPPADDRPNGKEIEETRAEVRGLRFRLQQQEREQERHQRRMQTLWVVFAMLIVTLAGAFWFAYPALRNQPETAAAMSGLQSMAGGLGGRVQSLEAKVESTSAGMPALSRRVDEFGASMKSSLQAAGRQAQASARQVGDRIREEVAQSMQAIQSRMTGIESNQREAGGRVNLLEEQIVALKQDLASAREEAKAAEAAIKGLQDEQQLRASAQAGINEKMTSQQAALNTLSTRVESGLEFKHVLFEIQPRRTEAIAPGIFLTIRRADAGKQEIDGTLQISSDARMIPIQRQGIQKGFPFYTQGEKLLYLVFTQVVKDRVSGYVVMPAETDTKIDTK